MPDAGVCVAIPANCDTTLNSPCCPETYRTRFNPPQNNTKNVCPAGFFCAFNKTAGQYPGSKVLPKGGGVCLRNAPDCGKLGKPCCIIMGGIPSYWQPSGYITTAHCNPGAGLKGYCAAADGSTNSVKSKDLICHQCPAGGCPKLGTNATVAKPDAKPAVASG
jgi:hypothetical protein